MCYFNKEVQAPKLYRHTTTSTTTTTHIH